MLGVVAHDAGAAEIISSQLRQQRAAFACTLEGAARHVFERKFGPVENLALEELVERSDWILCGTSFLSDLEWRAIVLARSAGKRVVAVLDHWINYRQRFFRHSQWAFPDEVWVGDEPGLALAGQEVPEAKAVLVPNAYFQDIRNELLAIPAPARPAGAGEVLLYVCEPLREDGLALYNDPLYWGYTEEDAVRYFLSNVGRISSQVERIIVRPHPQESLDKYMWAAEEFDLPIVTGENKTLLAQVVESDVVVGCATMAMVVGLLAGKRVVSCLPPGAKTQPLPHRTIERI